MHSRSILGAFLTLALSSFSAQGAPAPNCQGITATATATTAASTTTAQTTTDANSSGVSTTTQVTATATTSNSALPPTATDNLNNGNIGGDPQTSRTLSPQVIAQGFANDGQDVPAPGQVRSLTSTNNFINFCLTVPNLPITNGKQITTGSCNPAPIGAIPSVDNMPSSKFSFPTNFGTLKANTPFTIELNINNLQTGFFVNAASNYFAAPQQLNAQGQIIGHSHVVVEQLTALNQATPNDPQKFAFFKGLNAAAAGGKLTADVTSGLPAGFYKLSSINAAANHQPVIVPIAQHGSLDDAIYFTVTADGNPLAGSAGAQPPAASLTSSTASEVSATASASASESATATSVTGAASETSTASASASEVSASASGEAASASATAATATSSAAEASTTAPAKRFIQRSVRL